MALMKGNKNSDGNQRHFETEESRITGLLNFVVALAIAAVAYTDWIVVANISLGYLYVLPIALSALINPLPLTIALALGCTFLQDIFGPADALQVRVVRGVMSLAGSGGGLFCHAHRQTASPHGGRGATPA
jgi:hypothetical protein